MVFAPGYFLFVVFFDGISIFCGLILSFAVWIRVILFACYLMGIIIFVVRFCLQLFLFCVLFFWEMDFLSPFFISGKLLYLQHCKIYCFIIVVYGKRSLQQVLFPIFAFQGFLATFSVLGGGLLHFGEIIEILGVLHAFIFLFLVFFFLPRVVLLFYAYLF